MKGPTTQILLALVASAISTTKTSTSLFLGCVVALVVVDAFPVVVVGRHGSRHPQPQNPTTPTRGATTTSWYCSTTSLRMGGDFLEGRIPKNDIRAREDEAMWVDDGSDRGGRWNPFQKKKLVEEPTSKAKSKTVASKPASKKATKQASATESPKKIAGTFKMPWDK